MSEEIHLKFSTDEEIEDLEDHDATVRIVGYVETIMSPAPAGRDQTILFKVVLSNGNKKIDILIWEPDHINKFVTEIRSRRVIEINGGYCREINKSVFKADNKFVPYEIIIKEYTAVSFLGFFKLQNQKVESLQKTDFDDIQNLEGLIQISGYIRTKFSVVHNRSGLMTYGLGAITDGKKKLSIQVPQFDENSLEVGDHVTIVGTVNRQNFLVTVICENMTNIKFNPYVESIGLEKIQRASRPLKRSRTS